MYRTLEGVLNVHVPSCCCRVIMAGLFIFVSEAITIDGYIMLIVFENYYNGNILLSIIICVIPLVRWHVRVATFCSNAVLYELTTIDSIFKSNPFLQNMMRDARLLEMLLSQQKKGTNMIVIQTKLVSQYTTKHFDLKIVLSVFRVANIRERSMLKHIHIHFSGIVFIYYLFLHSAIVIHFSVIAFKPRDIVVTDDFDIKRTQPASNSKKIVAEIDVLTGQNVLTGQMILISRELNLEIKLSLC
ncbi:hypothetical protein ACJX0J_024705 [Zea mays]